MARVLKARWKKDKVWVTSMMVVTACLASKDIVKCVESQSKEVGELHEQSNI